ncbi:MAG: hypothetical protein WCJ35_26800 [Planctomycetota bacterium]
MRVESGSTTASYPALASLGLGGEDLAALAKQGNLHAEEPGQGKRYAKLRFRVGRKQCVRYVGNNPEFTDRVRRELARLQAPAKSCRRLQRLVREANACLQRTKQQLKPLIRLAGYGFHGREIRRRREQSDPCVDSGKPPKDGS